jgi:hypothetical protein
VLKAADNSPRRRLLASTAALVCLVTAVYTVEAAEPLAVGRFAERPVDAGFGEEWTVTELPSITPARFRLEEIDGRGVVRVDADNAAASLTRALRWDPADQPWLTWQWQVDDVVSGGDIRHKAGDDLAARLYVFFDYDLDRLSWTDRVALRMARWLHGEQVPAAALCYVWANQAEPGARMWNAYTDRVRVVVLRNGDDPRMTWVSERRNLLDDYREAFGDPVPDVTGVAIAADTDQTGESVTAWFGDIRAEP